MKLAARIALHRPRIVERVFGRGPRADVKAKPRLELFRTVPVVQWNGVDSRPHRAAIHSIADWQNEQPPTAETNQFVAVPNGGLTPDGLGHRVLLGQRLLEVSIQVDRWCLERGSSHVETYNHRRNRGVVKVAVGIDLHGEGQLAQPGGALAEYVLSARPVGGPCLIAGVDLHLFGLHRDGCIPLAVEPFGSKRHLGKVVNHFDRTPGFLVVDLRLEWDINAPA